MRKLLKLDFQRLFNGVLFKLALGVCAVLGIWDLVLNVQAHYANIEALKTQTIAYSYPSSVYNSCIAADGLYLPSILLFSLFPLLVTLPAGISMAMDIKSGYIKNLRAEKRDPVTVHLDFCGGVSAGNGGNFWTDDFQYDVPSNDIS